VDISIINEDILDCYKAQALSDRKLLEGPTHKKTNLLQSKFLALQVEIGKLADEWQGYKFWSEDQKPRTRVEERHECLTCGGRGTVLVEEGNINCHCLSRYYNPMLERYVKCFSFLLSIGNDIKIKHFKMNPDISFVKETVIETFNELFFGIQELREDMLLRSAFSQRDTHRHLMSLFFDLGAMLGFTWNQVKNSYLKV